MQFFDSGFKPTNASAQLHHLIVKKQGALGGLQLSPLKLPTPVPAPLPIPSRLRRSRRKWDSRLRLSRQVPRRNLELPRQAKRRLQLEALDVTGTHLARRVGRDSKNVTQFRVIQTPDKLLKAFAEIRNCHVVIIT